jgi:hypothetical protein
MQRDIIKSIKIIDKTLVYPMLKLFNNQLQLGRGFD